MLAVLVILATSIGLTAPAGATPTSPTTGSSPSEEPTQPPNIDNSLLPSDGLPAGSVPDNHYEIMYSTGGTDIVGVPSDPIQEATGWFTNLVFVGTRWIVHGALSMDNWSWSFHIETVLGGPAESLATDYQNDIIRPLGVGLFSLFCCAAYAAWMIFRGRMPRGAGEFGVSLLILAMTTATWAAPNTFLLGSTGVLARTREVTAQLGDVAGQAASAFSNSAPGGAVPVVSLPSSTSSTTTVSATTNGPTAELLQGLHHAFVEVPYQVLNWGEQLDTPGSPSPCLVTEQKILEQGPWGTSDTPRNMMAAAGPPVRCAGQFQPIPERRPALVPVAPGRAPPPSRHRPRRRPATPGAAQQCPRTSTDRQKSVASIQL